MALFDDPIRTLRIELPAGWAYDPFFSTLTEFYFARWDRPNEQIIVRLRPPTVLAGQPDEIWLAKTRAEVGPARPLFEMVSASGRAVGAAFNPANGPAQRVAFVRALRLEFVIEQRDADERAVDPWAALTRAVSTVASAANMQMPRYVELSEINRVIEAANKALAEGEPAAVVAAFQKAVWMGTSTWLYSIAAPDLLPEIYAALRVAQALTALGRAVEQPFMLRDAEFVLRRAQRSMEEAASAISSPRKLSSELAAALDTVVLTLCHQVEPNGKGPLPPLRALRTRGLWLARSANTAMTAKDLKNADGLAGLAVEDLLSYLALARRNAAQEIPKERTAQLTARGEADPQAVQRATLQDMETLVLPPLNMALQTRYACAMDRQDAEAASEATALLVPTARLICEIKPRDETAARNLAVALMYHSGSCTLLGDESGLAEAARFLEEATHILDHWHEEGHLRAQLCLDDGWVRFYRRRHDGLAELIKRGLAAAKATKSSQIEASLYALQSQLLVGVGRFQEALAAADAAIAGNFERPLSTHLLNRAISRYGAGDSAGALEDLRQALSVALPDNPMGEDVLRILFVAASYTEPVDLSVSLELTRAAQSLADARRMAFNEPMQRIAFDEAAHHREVAAALVTRLFEAGRYGEALAACDRSRARTFNQLLGEPTSSRRRIPSIPTQTSSPPSLEGEVIPALQRAADYVRSVADRALETFGFPPALEGIELVELVSQTNRPALMLQPVGELIHLILILPQGDVRILMAVSDASLSEVLAAMEQAQTELGVFALSRARSGDQLPLADVESDRSSLDEAIMRLSTALLPPVIQSLPKGVGLTIVPYRELALVPYPLLRLPDNTPLVERYAVSVVPSLTSLAMIRRPQEKTKSTRFLILGDPAVDPQMGLAPLPAAAAEAETICKLLLAAGVDRDRIILRIRQQATEAEYKKWAGGCTLVHFACHAAVREPAARSSLFLTSGPHDDGLLVPVEITEIRLPGALVFLSACQTGLGRPTADGVIGLSRAFLEAGACAVMMSLWKVADEATAVLAGYFYQALLSRENPPVDAATALQRAMLATRDDLAAGRIVTLRNEVMDDHPAHWAPFLLLGDGGFNART